MDAEKIFDAISKVSVIVCLKDKRSRKLKQIASVKHRRCGNCTHWMKSTCAPEKERGEFKSCNSIACKDFAPCSLRQDLLSKFESELKIIEAEIDEYLQKAEAR